MALYSCLINTYRPSTGAYICKYFFDQYTESIDPPLEPDFKHPKAKSKAWHKDQGWFYSSA